MILVLLFLIISPDTEGWSLLEKVTVTQEYDEFMGEQFDVPVFSEDLKSKDGERIAVEGYVIPLQQSGNQDYFVLSRFPYNNCFFCGNAGPETVAEVYTKDPFPYKDAMVRVTGTLKLNSADPMHLFFILSDATVEVLD